MNTLGVTLNDSWQISFVYGALLSQAITYNELNIWGENLIRDNEVDNIPDYIFRLIDVDSPEDNVIKIIGFAPHFPFKRIKEVENSLVGIAYLRGMDVDIDDGDKTTRVDCLKALKKHQEVLAMFKKVFPFIGLPDALSEV